MNLKRFFYDWVIPVGSAVIIALLINKFIFFNVKIPTESMDPTIKIGDRAFVTKIYNFDKLKRGDILVFQSEDKELKYETLIKRLIGVPGDEVIVDKEGNVIVNGQKLDEPYVELKGGPSGTFKVPEECYFFMGDNRTRSLDSRSWENKYISKEHIKGKAQFIIWPFSRMGKLK